MGVLKDKNVKKLIAGLDGFESSRNAVKNADYKDLKAFVADFLNTPDKKQRKKLSEEFKRRHLELHQFIKENTDLIDAETEISKTVANATCGIAEKAEDEKFNNLIEMISESEAE